MSKRGLTARLAKEAQRAEREDEQTEEGAVYARARPPREPAQVYSVRLPVDRLQQLRQLADERGMAPSALLREWAVERIDAEPSRSVGRDREFAGAARMIAGEIVDQLASAGLVVPASSQRAKAKKTTKGTPKRAIKKAARARATKKARSR